MNNNNNNRTHYEVLGVDPSADLKTIRQAYLRASLQHHPDKNLDNVEAAKAQFILIGQAYDVLKDPAQRAQYDRELRSGTWRAQQPSSTFQPPVYDNYRNAFDAHVAGMSQAELQAAMGAAAIVGSMVGSFIASRATTSRGSQSLASSLLSTAGSLVGSVAASQAASSFVKSLHEQCVERVAYQEEQRAAVARGEKPPPEMVGGNRWNDLFSRTMDSTSSNTSTQQQGNFMNRGMNGDGYSNNSGNNTSTNSSTTKNNNSHWTGKINKAMDSAKEKAAAAAFSAAVASAKTPEGRKAIGSAFMSAAKAVAASQQTQQQRR